MIDNGYAVKLVAMSNLTNQEISIEYNKFQVQANTQVVSTQIIPHVEKMQPQPGAGMRYDVFFYVKFLTNAKEIAQSCTAKSIQPSADGQITDSAPQAVYNLG